MKILIILMTCVILAHAQMFNFNLMQEVVSICPRNQIFDVNLRRCVCHSIDCLYPGRWNPSSCTCDCPWYFCRICPKNQFFDPLTCRCRCKEQCKDCTEPQVWNEDICNCVCPKPKKCAKNRFWSEWDCSCLCREKPRSCCEKKIWSDKACGCVCQSSVSCSFGFEWDSITCQCIKKFSWWRIVQEVDPDVTTNQPTIASTISFTKASTTPTSQPISTSTSTRQSTITDPTVTSTTDVKVSLMNQLEDLIIRVNAQANASPNPCYEELETQLQQIKLMASSLDFASLQDLIQSAESRFNECSTTTSTPFTTIDGRVSLMNQLEELIMRVDAQAAASPNPCYDELQKQLQQIKSMASSLDFLSLRDLIQGAESRFYECSATTTLAPFNDLITPGEVLFKGQSKTSANGSCNLLFQNDGNLVLMDASGAIFLNSQTAGLNAYKAILSPDGFFSIQNTSGAVIWSYGCSGPPGSSLKVLNQCWLIFTDGSQNYCLTSTSSSTSPTPTTTEDKSDLVMKIQDLMKIVDDRLAKYPEYPCYNDLKAQLDEVNYLAPFVDYSTLEGFVIAAEKKQQECETVLPQAGDAIYVGFQETIDGVDALFSTIDLRLMNDPTNACVLDIQTRANNLRTNVLQSQSVYLISIITPAQAQAMVTQYNDELLTINSDLDLCP